MKGLEASQIFRTMPESLPVSFGVGPESRMNRFQPGRRRTIYQSWRTYTTSSTSNYCPHTFNPHGFPLKSSGRVTVENLIRYYRECQVRDMRLVFLITPHLDELSVDLEAATLMPTRKITRVARRTAQSQPQQKESESASLIDFLSVLQQNDIALLPIYFQKGLSILGRGLSGLIQQSTADIATILAFKEGIPSRIVHDTEQDQDWYSLITELSILQHPPLKANPHLVNVLGVSFSVTSTQNHGQRAWPLIITSKANRGNLSTILGDEQSDFLTQETRMILFAGFAEAVFVLHSCGVSHGDLKTDNILVQTSKSDEPCLLLIDFGSSVICGQTRIPTKSEPWNAPELELTTRNLDYNELAQTDLYSFGLLCLHLLLPLKNLADASLCLIRTHEQTDDQWTKFLSEMKNKKMLNNGGDFVCQILNVIESSNVPSNEKDLLIKIVKKTIQPPSGKRELPWYELLPCIQNFLSVSYHTNSRSALHIPPLAFSSIATEHSDHLMFDLGIALGELDDTDYVLQANILQDLIHKADYSACEFCRLDFAFQVSICRTIGLGCGKDMIKSEQWRATSRRTNHDLIQAVQKIEKSYVPPIGIPKDLADTLGIGILICAQRTEEYQISRRIFEAEQALKDRIEARASLFGESHLSLGNSKSELSQVLQAQNRLAEAEIYQVKAIEIFSKSLGDRHSSVLRAKFEHADLMARQGLLRKAENLALETQPIFDEVFGSAHPDTAAVTQILGTIQFRLGKTREAEQSMKKVVMFRNNALTSTHPSTIRAEMSLATVLRGQGRFTDTNKLMNEIDLKLSGVLAGNELTRAQLSMVQAALHRGMGQLKEAFQKIDEGLAALDKIRLPANDGLRLDMLEILASLHGDIGELEKEETILRQILGLIGRENERNRNKSRTECLLAGTILAQSRESEAYALAEKVSVTLVQSSIQDPDNYVTAIDIMANALCFRGQINEAEKMRRDLLDHCINKWGENNIYTLNATYSLGILLADRGDERKAQALYEQALRYLEKDIQPSEGKIIVTKLLAGCLADLGEFEKAQIRCQQGIAWAISIMGERYKETLALYNVMGKIYILTGQLTQADELYSTMLHEQVVGTEVECYVLEHMAVLRRRQLRIPEAMELKRKSEALMKSRLGEFHPEFVRMQGNVLADYMINPEDFTIDIEKDVLKNIDRKKAILGTDHPSTIVTMCDLAYAWAQKRRLVEADELFEKLWATGKVSLVKKPEEYAKILGKRAEIRFSLGCLDDAEELEREALAIRLSIFDENHNSVLVAMGNLASTLCSQGEYEEAEWYLRQVLIARERTLEANVPSFTRYLIQKTALGAVLFYQKRFVESIEHYATSVTLAERMELPRKYITKWKEELKEIVEQSENGGTQT